MDFVGQMHITEPEIRNFEIVPRNQILSADIHRFYHPPSTPYVLSLGDITFYNAGDVVRDTTDAGIARPFGFRSPENNAVTGLSLWSPHAISKESYTPGIRCKTVTAIGNNLLLMKDRNYTATAYDGTEYIFTHYLITPFESCTKAELQQNLNNIVGVDCNFAAAGEGKEVQCEHYHDHDVDKILGIDFNLFDEAVQEGYAMQHVLQLYSKNNTIDFNARVSAAILAIWIGSNDLTVEIVAMDAPWAARFILNCFRDCPLEDSDKSSLRVYYSNAVENLVVACRTDTESSCAKSSLSNNVFISTPSHGVNLGMF